MTMISIKDAAVAMEISEQLLRKYCREGRIKGAIQIGRTWSIPYELVKPERTTTGKTLPKLANTLQKQKTKNNYHGLYDYVQIYFTYCSCRMASNRLTKDQVETIFRKGKVVSKFEPMKVSDCVEVLNHFVCIDFIINNVMEPLSPKLIKRLHYLLMFGSVDDRLDRVTPGKYRQQEHSIKGRSVISANQISSSLDSLIAEYEELQAKELVDILNFHVEFEMIAPFRDGNGRVGRLIMFKECLRHSIMPFIIDDKRRRDYLDGITKWSGRRKVFLEVAQETQARFEAQIDLHEYQKHGQNFLPDNYIE